MKQKNANLWFSVIAVFTFFACGQIALAQNIVKVDLDGSKSIKELLGESINEADSLVVSGKMADEDFEAIRMASIYGRLTGLNIESVTLEDNRLPIDAFNGADPMSNMTTAKFRYITLPDNLESFGDAAFSYCPELKYVNIPVNLKELGAWTFCECREFFKGQCLEIPAGVITIPSACFCSCEGMADVKFPDDLRRIESNAFQDCSFNDLILPEKLGYIGHNAFVFMTTSWIFPRETPMP